MADRDALAKLSRSIPAYEARYRPVLQTSCNSLGSRRYKEALSLINRDIRRYPNFTLLQLLRAVAQTYTGSSNDAIETVKSLQTNAGALSDANILRFAFAVLNECNRWDLGESVIAAATANNPVKEEILTESVNFSYQTNNWKRARQLNISMKKLAANTAQHRSGHEKEALEKATRDYYWRALFAGILAASQKKGDEAKVDLGICEMLAKEGFVPENEHELFVRWKLYYTMITVHLEKPLCEFPFNNVTDFQEVPRCLPINLHPATSQTGFIEHPELMEPLRKLNLEIYCEGGGSARENNYELELWARHVALEFDDSLGLSMYYDRLGKDIYRRHERNWATIGMMVRLAVKLNLNVNKTPPDSTNWPDYAIEALDAAIEENQEEFSSIKNMDFYLGRIELARLCRIDPNSSRNDLVEMIGIFLKNYAFEDWCFGHIIPFILELNSEERKQVAVIYRVSHKLDSDLRRAVSTDQKAGQHHHLLRFEVFFWNELNQGSTLNERALADKYANDYFRLYSQGQPANDTKVMLPDLNDVVLISAQLYLSHSKTADQKSSQLSIDRATTLLRVAVNRKDANYQVKMLAVRLNRLAGSCMFPLMIWDTLDVKQIQMDTLDYLLYERFSTFYPSIESEGAFSISKYNHKIVESQSSNGPVKFWEQNVFEGVEDVSKAHSWLQYSLTKALYYIEEFRCEPWIFQESPELGSTMKALPSLEWIIESYGHLSDNRDFRIFPTYLPTKNGQFRPIAELSSMEPRVGKRWAYYFAKAYCALLDPRRTKQDQLRLDGQPGEAKNDELMVGEQILVNLLYTYASWIQSVVDIQGQDLDKKLSYVTRSLKRLISLATGQSSEDKNYVAWKTAYYRRIFKEAATSVIGGAKMHLCLLTDEERTNKLRASSLRRWRVEVEKILREGQEKITNHFNISKETLDQDIASKADAILRSWDSLSEMQSSSSASSPRIVKQQANHMLNERASLWKSFLDNDFKPFDPQLRQMNF